MKRIHLPIFVFILQFQDVMKVFLLCSVEYIMPSTKDTSIFQIKPSYLELINKQADIDFLDIKTMEMLLVKPYTVSIRRSSVNSEKYLTIHQTQSKYRNSSKLAAPRNKDNKMKTISLKVNKKRRDHLEIRSKTIKSTSVWQNLESSIITSKDNLKFK
jgi:hypothetical protein